MCLTRCLLTPAMGSEGHGSSESPLPRSFLSCRPVSLLCLLMCSDLRCLWPEAPFVLASTQPSCCDSHGIGRLLEAEPEAGMRCLWFIERSMEEREGSRIDQKHLAQGTSRGQNPSYAPLAKPRVLVWCCIHLEERSHSPNSHKGNVSSNSGPAHETFMKGSHIPGK